MSKWDKEYIQLCKRILTEGVMEENRTGVDTIKIPFYSFSFDLGEEFPVLTTKQLAVNMAILETLWMYQVQSNDVRWLQERGNKIWNEWEIDENGIWRATQMVPENGQFVKKTIERQFDKSFAHTIGTAYGYVIKKYQLTQRLINMLKNDPTNRRMVMSLWQEEFLDTAVLPSCVWSSEWDVTEGKLNCLIHQRSGDVPLGLPFNVTQYAVLVNLIAHCTGLQPGTMYWTIKNAHIYVNQIEGIKEQIKRFEELGDFPAPELWINPEITDFFEFDNSSELKDIKVLKYQHHGKIKMPIAQ